MSTTFEPDTAFSLEPGDFFISTSFSQINSFAFSRNSKKKDDSEGSASEFNSNDSDGYSAFVDSEMERRFLRIFYGLSSNIELQFTYRDFRFYPGNLDVTVENFHETLSLDNQGREITSRNRLDIYVHDNETGENIFVLTKTTEKFFKESITLGAKFSIMETKTSALSISLSSNYGDYRLERGINESTTDVDQPDHRDFNDHNIALRYSTIFDDFSLHAAYSVSHVGDTLFPKSPDTIRYTFLGIDWHLSDNWHVLMQFLNYSSPFPKEDSSNIADDIIEIAAGLRWFVGKEAALEIGFIENQTHGPQNIDIALFMNLLFYL